MPRVQVVSLIVTAAALSLSIVSAAPAQQGAATPQQPTVPWEAFRVDLATGALIPLESMKAKKETRGSSVYCYIEGAQSPTTIRSDEPLVFVFRYDGSPKNAEVLRKSSKPWHKGLEFVFISDKARRYATGKYVPVDVEPYGDVVSGVNPKKHKEVGQAFLLKPKGPLAPGEYTLSLVGMAAGSYPDPGCTDLAVSAFRIVDAPLPPQPAPPSSPTTTAPTNSAADIERMRHAADQGVAAAQIGLAGAYATGNGIPQDYQQTHQWLRKAADQGSAEAQYWLGVMYRDAVGVAPDQAQTAQFFRKAAEQGHALAQGNLGNLHFFGRGVLQDYVEAHKWFNIAAARLEGEDRKQCVDLRDKVAGLMTPIQVADAQKRATDWVQAFDQIKR